MAEAELAEIRTKMAAAFSPPLPLVGGGPEPKYRSPWRNLIPYPVTASNRGDAEFAVFMALADETPEMDTERMVRRIQRWTRGGPYVDYKKARQKRIESGG